MKILLIFAVVLTSFLMFKYFGMDISFLQTSSNAVSLIYKQLFIYVKNETFKM